LRPGELLRSLELPRAALMRRTAFRRASLTPLGRSGALLIGALAANGGFMLSITASTRRPVRLAFAAIPRKEALADRLDDAIATGDYYDDLHGRPDWRRHMTFAFAEEIRNELGGGRS
jgi:hypothetical protein